MVMTPHRLSELFVQHGVPEPIRSDNGLSWENAYIESLNGKLRGELLNGEIFETRWEATVRIERWRKPTTGFDLTVRWAIHRRRPELSRHGARDSH